MQTTPFTAALTKEFEFILHDEEHGRAKAYSHIRTEMYRKRRVRHLQAAHSLKTSSIMAHGPLSWRSRIAPPQQKKSVAAARSSGRHREHQNNPNALFPGQTRSLDEDDDDKIKETRSASAIEQVEPVVLESSCAPATLPSESAVSIDEPSTAIMRPRQPDPFTMLSAARTDPFRSYPIPSYEGLDNLVDFYARGLGPYLYGYTPNGEDDIFAHRGLPISLSDPAAFNSNMLMASINLDRISGHSLSGMRALRHRIEAIRLINEKLADPSDCISATTIYTVTILVCLEHNWGAVGSYEVHAAGLQQILIRRGGLQTLHHYPMLEHTIYSIALNIPRLLSFGSPAIYFPNAPHFSPSQERQALCDEFLTFLSSILSIVTGLQRSPILSTFSRSAFWPGSPILKLLKSPPSERPGFSADQASQNEERGRLSISLHVHCTIFALHHQQQLHQHQSTPYINALVPADSLEWHIRHFSWILARHWIWRDSPSMLRYLLVKEEDSARLHDAPTAWKVLRLTSVTAWLQRKHFLWVMDFLICLLSQSSQEVKGLVDGAKAKIEDIKRALEAYCREADNLEKERLDKAGFARSRDMFALKPQGATKKIKLADVQSR